MSESDKDIAFLVPVMNEEETILELGTRIADVMKDALPDCTYEIVFVDDGSTDGTWSAIQHAAAQLETVRGVKLRRNFGKAAALQVGLDDTSSRLVITMDGDLQDDPTEIPKFVAEIDAGYDVVSGWKRIRHDPVGKTLPSRLFNAVTRRVSGINLHDFNCGFKAYRREVFNSLDLYGELHRFVPVLAGSLGFSVGEIEVQHHPRRHGKSKYGLARLFKGVLDLLTVITLTRFDSRPGHLFGGIGLVFLGIGILTGGWLTMLWLTGEIIGDRPLLLFSVLMTTVGFQFVLFGMLAELFVDQRRGSRRLDVQVARAGD